MAVEDARACSHRKRVTCPSGSQPGLFLAACRLTKASLMVGQAFSVYLRRIFGLPLEQYSYIMFIIKAF
jgi:hypothetical protein